MTSNLNLTLTSGTAVTASKNNGTTFSFTPTSCVAAGSCPMNDNTKSFNGAWLYNWYAATAGVGTSSSSGDVDGSICPKGWRLPRDRGYYNLLDAHKISGGDTSASVISKIESVPLSFTTGISNSGWWVSDETGSYITSYPEVTLWYGHNFIYPTAYNSKENGSRIRCIAN